MVVHEPDRRHVKDQPGVTGRQLDTLQSALERGLTCLVELAEETDAPSSHANTWNGVSPAGTAACMHANCVTASPSRGGTRTSPTADAVMSNAPAGIRSGRRHRAGQARGPGPVTSALIRRPR
jgi:hypothetical protein